MANFDAICEWVLRQEDDKLSGKIENLGDGAGLTRFGVTSVNYPNMPDGFFSTMPTSAALQCAKDVYRQAFWNRFSGDQITDDTVAASLLSFAINDGEVSEVEMAQAALGLHADGVVGPMTLAAFNAPGAGDKIRAAQAKHYLNVANARPQDREFLNGWLKRANRIYPSLA